MEALIAHGITKRYATQTALDHVSLGIPENSIYGLLGPNGAGKTTFIRIINQIINADEGEILLFNEKLKPTHVGIIGYLPEERGLYKKLKVGDQLLYLALLKGLNRTDALRRIKTWVEKFEIKDWLNRKVEDLSKGMAQKVQFVSTVMHEPRLIILDEPFSGFDPVNAQLITDEILDLRQKGSTVIFSTHRMETVEELCDHIALIDKARKILEGPKKKVKEQYRTGTYIVEYRGGLTLPSSYEIMEKQTVEDGTERCVIRAGAGTSPNQILRELVDKTEVHSFQEKIPSMSDIFITLVTGNG